MSGSGSGSGEDNDKAIRTPPLSPHASPKSPLKISGGKKRVRTASNSTSSPSTEGPVVRSGSRTIYTAVRPPWYDTQGQLKEAFVIGNNTVIYHVLLLLSEIVVVVK